MRQHRIRQADLFGDIERLSSPWPVDLNSVTIVLLAQLMYSLLEAIEREAANEQD